MQEMIIKRVKELLSEEKGDRVLAWETGESAYDRTPAVYTAENIDSLKYDSLCGCNLSKYLISESAKDGKVIALIKPCDSYSLNQLLTEHRVNREKVYVLAVGCRGKIDVEKSARWAFAVSPGSRKTATDSPCIRSTATTKSQGPTRF